MKKLLPDPHLPNNEIAKGGSKFLAAITLANAFTSLSISK